MPGTNTRLVINILYTGDRNQMNRAGILLLLNYQAGLFVLNKNMS